MFQKIKKYLTLFIILIIMIGISYLENIGREIEILELAKIFRH